MGNPYHKGKQLGWSQSLANLEHHMTLKKVVSWAIFDKMLVEQTFFTPKFNKSLLL